MDEHFAESVAVSGLSEDITFSFSLRLGRLPPKDSGTLWMSSNIGGVHYAVAESQLALTSRDATPIKDSEVTFEVVGDSSAKFRSHMRHTGSMHGEVEARALAHPSSHPEEGAGEIPMSVSVAFRVGHMPVYVRPGRMEVMGRVNGRVQVGDIAHEFDMPGKWHEQTGPRPKFAPAFTYLFVQGEGIGIMTSKHVNTAWGYVLQNGAITAVTALDIDPYGANPRHLTVTLEDGRKIEATARIIREVSVPIEGHRRPGATVIVDSEIGLMVGALNDWDPAGKYDKLSTPISPAT